MNILSLELLIYSFIIFTVASCLGSFLKLVVDRYGTGESFVFKTSYCSNCKTNLLWWQNIPIISFLILKGKCHFCKSKIDINCFYSELFTSIVAVILFISALNKNQEPRETTTVLIFAMVLILLSMFDLKHRIIPHTITYTAIILVIISNFFTKDISLYVSFLNLGIAFLFMDLLYIFSSLVKKFDLEANMISIPLIVWSIFFLFSQNIYFLIIAITVYFFSVRLKIHGNLHIILWITLFFLTLVNFYKIFFIVGEISNLTYYFAGIGIIYFACEVITYFLYLIFRTRDANNLVDTKNSKITIGGGDITVFALISVFLGYKIAFLTLFIASLLATISHLSHSRLKKFLAPASGEQSSGPSSEYIPFVPFLSLTCFIIIITINGI